MHTSPELLAQPRKEHLVKRRLAVSIEGLAAMGIQVGGTEAYARQKLLPYTAEDRSERPNLGDKLAALRARALGDGAPAILLLRHAIPAILQLRLATQSIANECSAPC